MTECQVRRRHVFFLGGFDPKGASHYHRVYRAQAQLQGAVSGRTYEVGTRERQPGGNATWTILTGNGEQEVRTTYEFVRWDDIVRAHWPRTAAAVLRASVATYWTILRSGQLARVGRASPRTLIPLAVPALFWSLVPVAAVLGGFLAAEAGMSALGRVMAALSCGAVAACATVAWERRLNTGWLLRIYRFADLHARGCVPQLGPRLDTLAQSMAARLRDPQVDEVLLVGFSVGSMLAVSALAGTLRLAPGSAHKLGVVTLGQCIPLLGLMPSAAAFRAELREVAGATGLAWIDFSSVTDWGSFASVDPIGLCLGVPRAAGAPPRLASPRFHQLFAQEDYRRLRRDKRRMHLQYLLAGELPGEYDYFDLTAGPRALRSRLPCEAP